MLTIQPVDAISKAGLSQFPASQYSIDADHATPDAILVRSRKMHTYVFPESVKCVGRAGIGTDNIPVNILTERGIPLLYTPGANANAVKELVIAGLLIGCRQLMRANDFVHSLAITDEKALEQQVESQKKQFIGQEIQGKTLGVMGLGKIGVKVANAALALGMQVIGYDPAMTLENALILSPGVKKIDDIQTVLQTAHFITLHVPLSKETAHFMNAERLALLSPRALLLNFSRAQIVDQEALYTALTTKKLGGYITDFPSVKLKNLPDVLSLPHLGASTVEAEENCADIIVERVRHFLEYGNIKDSVNFPDVYLPWNAAHKGIRLGVTNRNIPGMIANISQVIVQAGYNINQMINQSRDTIAYNLIDISAPTGDALVKLLQSLSGVLRVSVYAAR